MDIIYQNFIRYLEAEDKEGAVAYILSTLRDEKIDIVALYEKILEPSLNNMVCKLEEKNMCIWKEHVRSSIVRTIIECCYPYVIKKRDESGIKRKNKKVIVVCPSEEYHEIGARMAADFFTLSGYESVFVGGNTPREDFISSIDVIKPTYIAISISNYYNLVAGKRMIERIRDKSRDVIILAGGNAFKNNSGAFREIGADLLTNSFEDIKRLAEEGNA